VRRVEHDEMSLPRRAGPRRGVAKTCAGTKGTCLAGPPGAAPPVTRTRSQSQTRQQPAGSGPALLPLVRSESLGLREQDARISAESGSGAGRGA
jgi:hypothetical protein